MGQQINQLQVDDSSRLFETKNMYYKSFPSDFSKVRRYALEIIKDVPEQFLEIHLLEQQISEILKNAIEHGNKNNASKKIQVWYDFNPRDKVARLIVEDEGDGFKRLEEWNEFYRTRTGFIEKQDLDNMMKYINYVTPESHEFDGGNALFAAVEYWNGGIVYNAKKNKVVVVKYFK
jgi:serine/threonine-protein kinase RsbW